MKLPDAPPPVGPAARRTRRWLAATAGALLASTVALTGGPASGPAAATPPPAATAADPATTELVLVTGDQLLVERLPSGELAVTAGPDTTDLDLVVVDDQTYVVPAAVTGLVGEVLDPELFNVSKLLDYGYDAAHGIPVIVSAPAAGGTPAAARAASGPGVAGAVRALPSIGATAFTLESPGDWWRALTAGPTPAGAASDLPAGLGKVWLDELIELSLADSVPLVGAPHAWDAGYDGSGITIAVLDTGIDDGHPDLAGKVVAAENFTPEPDHFDGHGHGTHVAGIAAGTGAAGGGTFTGVAPGAQLLNGKVCNSGGSCPASSIIEGMEWAAPQADVINMSIGSSPTDGTDLFSVAVNQLTAEHGVLFVISAGNSGPGSFTVTSPGTADAALTVGSVSKAEQLANTSSRGPRVGDHAIKPDLTAPGVDIVAARADGTSMGSPVDDFYTSAGGTSMAAPHVAAAAAILLQQDPALTPAALKAALATTAVPHPDLDVYQQGGGRLDLAAALDAPVVATRSPLDLGYFPYPHAEVAPVATEIGYVNRTDQPVSLDLALEVADEDGNPVTGEMLSVSPQTLSVAPGATATASLTLDVRVGAEARYGGYLVATSDSVVASRIPVGFTKEPETYDLVVEGITRDGQPAGFGSRLDIVNVDGSNDIRSFGNAYVDGVSTFRVPPGEYSLVSLIATVVGTNTVTEATFVLEPEIDVQADTTVVLDATEAVELTVTTPAHPDTTKQQVALGNLRRGESGLDISSLFLRDPNQRFFAVPTDPVELGQFEFFSDWRLGSPTDPTYLYRLVYPEPERIPAEMSYVADPTTGTDIATLENAIHSAVADVPHGEGRHSFRPWQASSVVAILTLVAPLHRTEYLSANDTRFRQQIRAPRTIFREPTSTYQPGEVREQAWLRSPVRPQIQASAPVRRTGDALQIAIPEWVDAGGHSGDRHTAVDTVEFRLYQDGELIAQADRPDGSFTMSPEQASYQLAVDVTRDAPDFWATSTSTSTTWTVTSQRPAAGTTVLPLLEVDYHPVLDINNQALPPDQQPGPPFLDLTVGHQPGSFGGGQIAGARLWVSYNDGADWLELAGRHLGNGEYRFVLSNRDPVATTGFASLRVEAWDADGNQVQQEITRAWRLAPR